MDTLYNLPFYMGFAVVFVVCYLQLLSIMKGIKTELDYRIDMHDEAKRDHLLFQLELRNADLLAEINELSQEVNETARERTRKSLQSR